VLVGETSGRMPGFRVWNASRELKKFVVASTLTELISKCMYDPVVLFLV